MKRRIPLGLLAPLVIAGALALVPARGAEAQTFPQLRVSINGGAATVIEDNGVGDLDLRSGIVSYNDTSSPGSVRFTVGVSDPLFTSPGNLPGVHVQDLHIEAAAGTKVELAFTDKDFTVDSPSFFVTSGVSGNLAPPGSNIGVTFDTYMDAANQAYAGVAPNAAVAGLITQSFLGSGDIGNSVGDVTKFVSAAGPFSLTSRITFDFQTGGTAAVQHTVLTSVPEGPSLALLLPGLLPLGLVVRRRLSTGAASDDAEVTA